MLKNNAISQRVFAENPDRGKQLQVFVNIWKIRQSECFYNNYLKKLFKSDEVEGKMKGFNKNVQEGTKEYLRLYHPNLYDSGYDPMNTYDFTDNQHLAIQLKKKHGGDEADAKDFATRLPTDQLARLDE